MIEIPNYMQIDTKRDIPSAVLAMFRKRERPDVGLYPQRIVRNPTEKPADDYEADFVRDARALTQSYVDGAIRTKGEVYNALLEKYGSYITAAVGDEERFKQARRRFDELNLPLPERISK